MKQKPKFRINRKPNAAALAAAQRVSLMSAAVSAQVIMSAQSGIYPAQSSFPNQPVATRDQSLAASALVLSPAATAPPGFFHTYNPLTSPSLQSPPDGWQAVVIPSGAVIYPLVYNFYEGSDPTQPIGPDNPAVGVWGWSQWFLPARVLGYMLEYLETDNVNWECLSVMNAGGPEEGYLSIEVMDGQSLQQGNFAFLRLVAA